jgi:hypothetical protein
LVSIHVAPLQYGNCEQRERTKRGKVVGRGGIATIEVPHRNEIPRCGLIVQASHAKSGSSREN